MRRILDWLKSAWLSERRPVTPRSVPREFCDHASDCYLCPRALCVGSLNSPDEPDRTKPRSSSNGRCVYFVGADGQPRRFRISLESANDHAKQRALQSAQHTPGMELDIPDFLKKTAD